MPARARVATTAGAARSNERCSGSRATRAGGRVIRAGTYIRRSHMRRFCGVVLALVLAMSAVGAATAQAPIENQLTLITPDSKVIHDAALKAFSDYAKKRFNLAVKVKAIPARTPISDS